MIRRSEKFPPKPVRPKRCAAAVAPGRAEHIPGMKGCSGRIWPTYTSVSGITPDRSRRRCCPQSSSHLAFMRGNLKDWQQIKGQSPSPGMDTWSKVELQKNKKNELKKKCRGRHDAMREANQ